MNYTFRENGGAYVNELIRKAAEDGSRTCTVSGNWEIEQAIMIPSDFTLVLDGYTVEKTYGHLSEEYGGNWEECGIEQVIF